MKKVTSEYINKKPQDLEKEEATLRRDIATMALEKKTNPGKDTNALFKKRKQLAVLLTVKNQAKTG